MNTDKVVSLISEYKRIIQLPESKYNEKYKWQAIKTFQENWNIQAEDFKGMFEKSFSAKYENLWASSNYYPKGMILEFAGVNIDKTRRLFIDLFDEDKSLNTRIKFFVAGCDELLEQFVKETGKKDARNHYHKDMRAISLYLSFKYPEKYYMYKFTMAQNFFEIIDEEPVGLREDSIAKYNKYLVVAEKIRELLVKDRELIDLAKKNLDETCYSDTNRNLLTQDFIWKMSARVKPEPKVDDKVQVKGADAWLKELLEKHCPDDRIQFRKMNEEELKVFLDENAGHMGAGEWIDFFKNLNIEQFNGKEYSMRFGLAFFGYNVQLMINELDRLNAFVEKLWGAKDKEIKDILDEYTTSGVKGGGIGLPTAILYLRDPSKYNIMMKKMVAGLARLNVGAKYSNRLDGYDAYNTAINEFKNRNNLSPQVIDILFSLGEDEFPPSKKQIRQVDGQQSQNTILYGPPGTGKTFDVVNRVLAIFNEEIPDDRKEAVALFNRYRSEGRVEYISFHQNYSYEEFIEGIKPQTDIATNELSYVIENGVFKSICKRAQKEKSNFDKLIDDLKDSCSEALGRDPISIKSGGSEFTITYRDGITFRVKPKSSAYPDRDYPASIENIRKVYEGSPEQDSIYNPTYVKGILKYLNEKGLVPYENSDTDISKPYVIVIDEINRGNISKIFGELITLIEDDKRIGAENETIVTLPYSKEKFGVPRNLYIIGTMNTADRSIALIDTALRRRFNFIEMMPNDSLIAGPIIDSIKLDVMLDIINKRIEYLYDRDHQIGHAYFINVSRFDDLRHVFRNRIFPLLQEYFYDDWEKIRLVLNDHKKAEKYQFIHVNGSEGENDAYKRMLFGNPRSLEEYEAKAVYSVNENAFTEPSSYKGIYSSTDENAD